MENILYTLFRGRIKFILLLLIFTSCFSHENKIEINKEFSGKGFIIFYKPNSGSTYNLIFIPLTRQNEKFEFLNKNFNNAGVYFSSANRILLTKLRENSIKYPILENYSLDSSFHNLYVCKVSVSFKVNSLSNKVTAEKYYINGKEVKFKYRYVNESFKFKNINILN